MSEVIKNRLKESVGKEIEVFLYNGFRYFGKLTNFDEIYVEILDYKSNSYKVLKIEDIKDIEVKIR